MSKQRAEQVLNLYFEALGAAMPDVEVEVIHIKRKGAVAEVSRHGITAGLVCAISDRNDISINDVAATIIVEVYGDHVKGRGPREHAAYVGSWLDVKAGVVRDEDACSAQEIESLQGLRLELERLEMGFKLSVDEAGGIVAPFGTGDMQIGSIGSRCLLTTDQGVFTIRGVSDSERASSIAGMLDALRPGSDD